MKEYWVWVEFVKPLNHEVLDDHLRRYGPYQKGFNTLIPLQVAWILLYHGYVKPIKKGQKIMIIRKVFPHANNEPSQSHKIKMS